MTHEDLAFLTSSAGEVAGACMPLPQGTSVEAAHLVVRAHMERVVPEAALPPEARSHVEDVAVGEIFARQAKINAR